MRNAFSTFRNGQFIDNINTRDISAVQFRKCNYAYISLSKRKSSDRNALRLENKRKLL